MTNQPEWRYAGTIGGVNPILHGGAYVFIDATGRYCPEMSYFMSDDDSREIYEYRLLLEPYADDEWYVDQLSEVASCHGIETDELVELLKSEDVLDRAEGWANLCHFFSMDNFDNGPLVCNLSEMQRRWAHGLIPA